MSDENTLNTDGEVDTLDNQGDDFDEQYVSREEYEKAMKKAEDQEKARKKREKELAELKASAASNHTGKSEVEDGDESTPSVETPAANDAPSGELSEIDELRLENKGITDPKELEIVKNAVSKGGMTVKEALQDDFVMGRIQAARQEKKVEEATDLSGKGGSESSSTEDAIIREFKKTGQIPDKEGATNIISAAAKKDKDVYNTLVSGS